jgi:hypothetical protein
LATPNYPGRFIDKRFNLLFRIRSFRGKRFAGHAAVFVSKYFLDSRFTDKRRFCDMIQPCMQGIFRVLAVAPHMRA